MQKRNCIALLPLTTAFALAGCGEGAAVTQLKQQEFPFGSALNYEQALDRREVCVDVTWNVEKDGRGREVVSYACSLAGIDDFNDAFMEDTSLKPQHAGLITDAQHVIKWFHTDGEYELDSTYILLAGEREENAEKVELNRRMSYQVAIDDGVTTLAELLAALKELRSPFGW